VNRKLLQQTSTREEVIMTPKWSYEVGKSIKPSSGKSHDEREFFSEEETAE
jgi:hypothetical protein